MNVLKISKFKAFRDELILNLANKNFLLYGENGAGKSSVYESIKFLFFRDKLYLPFISSTPEEQDQKISDFLSTYKNTIENDEFEISLNEVKYSDFINNNYRVFMFSTEDANILNLISLKELLNNLFVNVDDVQDFCDEYHSFIEKDVNEALVLFNETVKVSIDKEYDYVYKIYDTSKGIENRIEIRKYFNEAKINLIVILSILTVIQYAKTFLTKKKVIIVLDDFITSLDVANRSYLFKYLLEQFSKTQVLIFTHNVSFFNLCKHMIGLYSDSNSWQFANIYEIANTHKIYILNEVQSVQAIRDEINSGNTDFENIGNKIRKKFEVLLYEISKLLMIGSVEESSLIISDILSNKTAYFKKGSSTSQLIDRIKRLISGANDQYLANKIKVALSQYSFDEYNNLQVIIKQLKLYQKVTMHPMSHGTLGMPTFTQREIEQSLLLLEKFETIVSKLNGSGVNVSTA